MTQVQAEPRRVDDVLATDEARTLMDSGRESGELFDVVTAHEIGSTQQLEFVRADCTEINV